MVLIYYKTTLELEAGNGGKAGMDYYFLDGVGGSFKATILFDPYFLIATKPGVEGEVEEWIRRKFEGLVKKASRVLKEDLSMVRFPALNWVLEAGFNMMCWIAKSSTRIQTDIHQARFCEYQ